MRTIRWFLMCILGGFFLVAGVLKILDPNEFAAAILRYQLFGETLAVMGALWLPWTEVLAGVALFSGKWRPAACWLFLGMLVFFEVILLTALFRGLDIDCGCFGTNAVSSVSFALVRNLILIGVVVFLMKLESRERER